MALIDLIHEYNQLRKHVIGLLDEIKTLIQEEKYDKVRDFLEFSPGGDDFGKDNSYIDFGEQMDIDEVLDELTELKFLIELEKQNKNGDCNF